MMPSLYKAASALVKVVSPGSAEARIRSSSSSTRCSRISRRVPGLALSSSTASARPSPSVFGSRRCDTTPFRQVARSVATKSACACGNRETSRCKLWVAFAVCIVASTRCPVSAACSTMAAVSASRISPTTITFGLCRTTWRKLSANDGFMPSLRPISRWLTRERMSWCTNSIGSSSVTICPARVRLRWCTIAASVVDLPAPVSPVTSTSPALRSNKPVIAAGRPSSAKVSSPSGNTRNTALTPAC